MQSSQENFVVIEPVDLRKEELLYEILCRGQVPADTAEGLRAQFRVVRDLPKLANSPFLFAVDADFLHRYLDILRQDLFDSDIDFELRQQRRFSSKLAHVKNRLDLINPSSADEFAVKTELSTEFQILVSKYLERKQVPTPLIDFEPIARQTLLESNNSSGYSQNTFLTPITVSETFGDESVSPIPFDRLSVRSSVSTNPFLNDEVDLINRDSQFQPSISRDFARPILPASTFVNRYAPDRNSPSVPIYKWNISFSGTEGSLDAIAFLERVHELRIARGVNHDQLFNGAVDLFKEPALSWYRSIRHDVFSWFDLESRIKETFISPNHDEDVIDQIKSRKQGETETLTAFISVLRMKFSRLLKPWSVEDQINLVRRNLKPDISQQLALMSIKSYEELESYCRLLAKNSPRLSVTKVERPRRILREVNPVQSSPVSQALPRASINNDSDLPATPIRTAVDRDSPNSIKCWNCSGSGHLAISCPKPRHLFCYGCGASGKTRYTCGDCNTARSSVTHQENQSRGSTEGATASMSNSRPVIGPQTGAIPKRK